MATISSRQKMQDAFEAERAQTRSNYERELEKTKEEYEETLTSAKEDYSEQLVKSREEANSDIRKLKEDLYDRKGRRQTAEDLELYNSRKTLQNYREELENDTNRRLKKAEEFANSRGEKTYEEAQRRTEDAVRAQKRSTAMEVADLTKELDTYRNHGNDVIKEKAAARGEAIQEFEHENIKERDRIVGSFEREIKSMKHKEGELKDKFGNDLYAANERANSTAERLLREQKREFQKIQKDNHQERELFEADLHRQLSNVEHGHQRAESVLAANNETDRVRALQQKDKAYLNYLDEKNNYVKHEIGEKDKKILELSTTDDRLKASPFLVDRIEKDAAMRNHERLLEAKAVHDRNLSAEKKRDHDTQQDLRDEYRQKFTSYTREHQNANDLERRQYNNSFTQLNDMRTNEKAQMKKTQSEMLERTSMKSNEALAREQRRTREELDFQRDELLKNRDEIKNDLEMKGRLTNRDWSLKLNATHRDFNKKMTEQQDLHDTQMTEMRFEYDKKLREQERNSTRALTDRVKAYEHQIRQQEMAFKERERFLTEHYEEELDKMKRSNARLIQKKS